MSRKPLVALLFACSLCLAPAALAQYSITSAVVPYQPLTGATVVTLSNNNGTWPIYDEGFVSIPLGFSFTYYGTAFTAVGVNSNGILVFGNAVNQCNYSGTSGLACTGVGKIPDTARTPHNFIAPWNDDLSSSTGQIRYVKTATELTIEFAEYGYYQSTDTFSFQVRLFASGLFQIHYGTHAGIGKSASLGFENANGSAGASLLPCSTAGANCNGTTWPKNTLFTIGQPATPDLVVDAVTYTAPALAGGNLGFSVTPSFRNVGQQPANGFQWKAVLSADRFLDPADLLVFTSTSAVSVAAGGTASATGAAVAAPKPPPGVYYVLVQADSASAVSEFSELNNVGSGVAPFAMGPDLTAVSVIGPGLTGPGNPVTLQVKLANAGNEPAAQVAYRILLSKDQILDVNDFTVSTGQATLAAGQTLDQPVTFTLPPSVVGGDLYWGLEVDSGKAVVEAAEDNNAAFSVLPVRVQQADLVVDSVELLELSTGALTRTAYMGQPGKLKVQVRNSGGANAAPFKIGVVLSTDDHLSLLTDLIVHDEPVNGMTAGTVQVLEFNFPVPLKDKQDRPLPGGTYHVFALLDSYSQITELSEDNNALAVLGPVLLRAPAIDYTVLKLDAPAGGAVGELVPIFRVLKNVGNVAGTPVNYRYYASVNDIITPEDLPLKIVGPTGIASETGMVTLAIGAEDKGAEFVQLPPQMPPGPYYIGCRVDSGDAVVELDENNNALAAGQPTAVSQSTLRVLTATLPDARVERPFLYRLVAQGAPGPTSWSLDATQGALPEGLTLDADGTLQGTPKQAGVTAFTVNVQSLDRAATGRLVLRVMPTSSELAITTVSLPAVVNSPGREYLAQLGAVGGAKPYSWKVASGALPAGLELLPKEGRISGVLRAGVGLGESRVTLEVRDALGSAALAEVRIKVVEPGALVITLLVLPDSMAGSDYARDLTARNMDGSQVARPLAWSVASGALPDGLVLTTELGERGLVAGKPQVAGTYAFALQVEDSKGRVDVVDYVMRVFAPALQISAVSPPGVLHPNDAVSYAFSAGGSSATKTTFSVYSGALPLGLSLTAQGTVEGTIPAEGAIGTYNFIVEARDGSGSTGLGAFALEVAAVPRTAGCSAAPGSHGGMWIMVGVFSSLFLVSRRRRARTVVGLRRRAPLAGALLLALAVSAPAFAQGSVPYQVVGPTSAAFTFLSGGTPVVSAAASESVNLPFAFRFYGQSYQSVTVSLYGYLTFSGVGTQGTNIGIPHSNNTYPANLIAPWWDTLVRVSGVTFVRVQTLGTEPNRRFVVEWKEMGLASTTGPRASFQVTLYEGTQQIRLSYAPFTMPASPVGSASVGIMEQLGAGLALLPICTNGTAGSCTTANFPGLSTMGQAIDIFLPPDLTVASVGGEDTGYAGVPFRASALLRNGGGRTAMTSRVRFYLSTDAAWDAADDQIADSMPVDVPAQGEALASASGGIPIGKAPGNYFLIAKADPDNAVVELDENNNLSTAVAVKVGPPTADLVVNAVTGPTTAVPGQTLTVNRVIFNAGNAPAPANIKYTYVLSDNSVASISDAPLGTAFTLAAALGVNGSSNLSDQVALPTDLPAGRYWLGVCVDYDAAANPTSVVSEISEVNNCTAATQGFIVNTGALAVLTTSLQMAAQYSPYGLRLLATGGNGAYAWSLSAGQLPPGFTLSPDGDFVGTGSAAGTFAFDVKVTSGAEEKIQPLSLTITPANLPLAIVDQQLPTAEFSRRYSVDLVAVGGKPPYLWALQKDSRLPAGLALSSDGHIEGRATEVKQLMFTVEITDKDGAKAAKDLNILVTQPTSLQISTSRLATGTLGLEYVQLLEALGGRGPYEWTVETFQQLAENPTEQPGPVLKNKLPDDFGLKLDKDGDTWTLRGMPAKAGLFAVTLKVVDQGTGSDDFTTLPLRVSYDRGLAIVTTALPDAFVGQSYVAGLSHNGGKINVKFENPCVKQVDANLMNWGCAPVDPLQTLPPGLTLSEKGELRGTPLAPPNLGSEADPKSVQSVTYSFLVKVSDDAGRQDVRSLSIKVRPDFTKAKTGCSGTALPPSLLALIALAGLSRARSRRRG